MQISARNSLSGTVHAIRLGSIDCGVTLEVSTGATVITRASAERLGLKEGMPAHAVIKASDVMIAVE